MKQSSTETQQKKLVQARLPFQILSPGVKTPAESLSEQRKRKASETPTEDDDLKVTDVKENQAAPVEKKPKIVNNNDEKTNQSIKKVENEEEKMEVDEVKGEVCKSVSSTKLVPKEKCKPNRTKNVKNKCKITDKSNSGRKQISVFMKKETIKKHKTSESDIVAFVDLSDSPCKNEDASEKPVDHVVVPKFEVESSLESEKEVKGNKLDTNFIKEQSSNHSSQENEKEVKVKDRDSSNSKEAINSMPARTIADNNKEEPEITGKDSCSDQTPILSNNLKTDLERKQASPKVIIERLDKSIASISPDFKVLDKSNISNNESEQSTSSVEPKTPSRRSQSSLDELVSRTPLNDSNTSLDNSLSSDCITPTDTPKVVRKYVHKTPRRITPKQLMKKKEREEKMREKERLKQEKKKKKAEEKEEKQRLKQEKEEEKLRQKQEKEEEKRKEKEEKDRKKQEEIAQKNEEKRLKEEEKRLKDEEKRAKDEEKKKREEEEKKKKEEKRLKEEQKEAEKRKSAQAFASFFLKSENKSANVEEENESKPEGLNFQPFEVKNDMRLAPPIRNQLTQDRKLVLDSFFDNSTSECDYKLYLQELHQPSYIKGTAGKTWPASDDMDDDVIIIESELPNEEIETDIKQTNKKSVKKRHRAKLLQFHENRRPPYWGTWRKKSKFIRPRNPLNEDKTMFEYDIDSDDEWEEPEDGESLRGSEDDESQDEQYEEDNEMFVPHGYLSDEEGQDEFEDKSPEAMKAKLKLLQLEFEAERNEKQEKLKPRLIGCVWFCNLDSDPAIVGSHISELFLTRRAVWDSSLPLKMAPATPPTPPTPSEGRESEGTPGDSERGAKDSERGAKRKLVPESMIPRVIRIMHGNRKKLSRLLVEILSTSETSEQPSKRCLAEKIREMASWTNSTEAGHHCWYVKDEVRKAYDLMDLIISPPPPVSVRTTPKANITKFTKVLTSDERLKLLSSPSTPIKSPTVTSVKTLPTHAKGNPVMKKRIPFVTVGPVLSANSIRHFVSVKSEELPNTTSSDAEKKEDKVKKRITPITLTSTLTKPSLAPSSKDDCIVLSD